MSDSQIRVGVIGAGGNTRRHHIPKLQAIDGVEVSAVSNRSVESGQRVADEFGIAQVYADWPTLIADDSLDAIVIGTWPDMHAQLSIAALEAGKHVLCEARLARTVAEGRAMLAAAQARPQLVAQVVPAPFTLASDRTIESLLATGTLGDLISVEVVERSVVDPGEPLLFRHQRRLSGVNVMTLGIHYESLRRWLGDATRVNAVGRTAVGRRPDADGVLRPVDVPDHLEVTGVLASGPQLRILLSQATAPAGGQANGIYLYGTTGTLHIAGEQLTLHRLDSAAEEVELISPVGWRVEEEFIGAIRGEEPVRFTTFADGVEYLRFTEAVDRSLHEHRQVSLSEI
ncbi:Gfo/Idh/MocA family protein [Parenemella sanctibonifatiensis]|uniref:Uncharacterized protein n=1 Tax=Parenemella sanctibonifatiensis TaxID=2016505 RepID=A0A255EM07_9ACTN|nr:Gfo/Idh/MocA family oxidoreductase [Parenemella sanctibonifatiensis]OYN92578.1 hypothetical protein CGZ91_03630 [Parenemella sanctibonifatiensis]